jgi:hypothetical protein
MQQARPILFGILNMALPGLGYVFLPQRRVFGWLLFIGTLTSLIARRWGFQSAQILAPTSGAARLEIFSIIFMTIAFGIDAYLQAKNEV